MHDLEDPRFYLDMDAARSFGNAAGKRRTSIKMNRKETSVHKRFQRATVCNETDGVRAETISSGPLTFPFVIAKCPTLTLDDEYLVMGLC